MAAAFFEIVELPNGDIVLQRSDGDGKALLTIRFSPEACGYLADAKLDVAKIMIQAGVQAAGESNGSSVGVSVYEEEDLENVTLH